MRQKRSEHMRGIRADAAKKFDKTRHSVGPKGGKEGEEGKMTKRFMATVKREDDKRLEGRKGASLRHS